MKPYRQQNLTKSQRASLALSLRGLRQERWIEAWLGRSWTPATRRVWLRGQSALLTAREMEIFEHIFDAGRQGCTMLALCNAIHAERPVGSATPDPYVLVVLEHAQGVARDRRGDQIQATLSWRQALQLLHQHQTQGDDMTEDIAQELRTYF